LSCEQLHLVNHESLGFTMHFTSHVQLKLRGADFLEFLMKKVTQLSEFFDACHQSFAAWVRREIIDDDPWDGVAWNVEEGLTQLTSAHVCPLFAANTVEASDRC
jgi:hypothetical protein